MCGSTLIQQNPNMGAPQNASSTDESQPQALPASRSPSVSPNNSQREFSKMTNDEHDSTRKKNSARLVNFCICAAGINVCFLLYGLMQEQIYVAIRQRNNISHKTGPITAFILVSQSVTNALVAWGWMKVSGKSSSSKNKISHILNYKRLIMTAVCYSLAMTSSNESLNYVSYPTATLGKSCKLLPTMVAGILVERKNYSKQEWFGALCLMTGIAIFNLFGTTKKGGKEDSLFGILLLFMSLFMDGCLSWCQGMLKQDVRPPTSLETMLWTNVFSICFFGPYSLITGQYANGIQLLSHQGSSINDDFSTQLIILNILAAAGQFFIFYTLDKFSPTVCTTLTTTRKFVSILLSVQTFGHHLTWEQWAAVGLVFGGLYAQIAVKVLSKQHHIPGSEQTKKNH